MALDWLFGPKLSDETAGAFRQFGSSFTINATDVQQIAQEIERVGLEASIVRGTRSIAAHHYEPTLEAVDIRNASDPDLASIFVVGHLPPPSTKMRMIAVGLGYDATAKIEAHTYTPPSNEQQALWEKLPDRIATLIADGGRRSVPPWRRVQLVHAVVAAGLILLWIWSVVSVWPNVALAIVSAVALLAGQRWAYDAVERRARGPQGSPMERRGRVRIDTADRQQLRNKRASSHRDWWLIAATFAATVLAAAVTWLLSGRPAP